MAVFSCCYRRDRAQRIAGRVLPEAASAASRAVHFLAFPVAQATASSGFIPWTALAYMSTMMYLVTTSAAFWVGGPA